MKIAIAANFDKKVAIDSRGGSEVFTFLQANELAKRDSVERVIVFGVGENFFSNKKIEFVSLLNEETRDFILQNKLLQTLMEKRPDAYPQVESVLGTKLFAKIQTYLNDIDLFHNNSTSSVFNSLVGLINKPIVTTLHTNGDSPSIIAPYSLGLLNKPNHYFVQIANHQGNYLKENNIQLNISRTIYNGIDVNHNTPFFETKKTDMGLWLGRISQKHNKGVKEAIVAVNQTHGKLSCYVAIDDRDFYRQEILPERNSNIVIDEKIVSFSEKIKLYQDSAYFIYPIMWEEPFGLVLIEAMACGTPVIAYAKGAVSEIVQDGLTGFIVNSSESDKRGDWIIKKTGIEGLVEAIQRINSMSEQEYLQIRKNCRVHVEKNFTVERMVDQYEALYKEIIEKNKTH